MLIITNIPFDERLNFRIDNSGFKVISFICGYILVGKLSLFRKLWKWKSSLLNFPEQAQWLHYFG